MPGTTTSAGDGARIRDVQVTDRWVRIHLADGREVAAPVSWYPRLDRASSEQRANWQLSAGGFGVHWPEIDEDLSVEGILRGAPSPEAG